MANIYEGDPRIFITDSGAYLDFRACQPVMDGGIENALIISLYTEEGWAGNYLFDTENKRVGSKFEEANRRPITKQYLLDRIDAADKALEWLVSTHLSGGIPVELSNPNGNRVEYKMPVRMPSGGTRNLFFMTNGINWREQILNPASAK